MKLLQERMLKLQANVPSIAEYTLIRGGENNDKEFAVSPLYPVTLAYKPGTIDVGSCLWIWVQQNTDTLTRIHAHATVHSHTYRETGTSVLPM